MNWIIWAILGIGAVVAGVIFREEVWDSLVDGFSYMFSFEWVGDIWEFVTGMFDNLSEFSVGGLAFGSMSAGFIYLTRNYMLGAFTTLMDPTSKVVWTIATYAASFIVGYLVGKRMFDD